MAPFSTTLITLGRSRFSNARSHGRSKRKRSADIGGPFASMEVADRPLSLQRRTYVSAPPFFDLPLSRRSCIAPLHKEGQVKCHSLRHVSNCRTAAYG